MIIYVLPGAYEPPDSYAPGVTNIQYYCKHMNKLLRYVLMKQFMIMIMRFMIHDHPLIKYTYYNNSKSIIISLWWVYNQSVLM